MNIAMVVPHYDYLFRGAEGVVREISKRLLGKGHQVDFITIPSDGVRIDRGIGRVWRSICDRSQLGGFFRKFIGFEPDLSHFSFFLYQSKNFVDNGYDVLWNHGEMFGALLCYKIRRQYGIPFVSTFHGNISMMMIMEGLLKPDFYSVLTPEYLCFIKNKVRCNVDCIPNGVDLDFFNPDKKQDLGYSIPRPWYISTSAHQPHKHVEQAIEYVADREGSLIITSKGPMTMELKKLCKKKLEGRHMFLGVVDFKWIPVLLASSDFYITCSSSEGHSLAILEALACGLEVVSPNADENIRWTIGSNNRCQAERFSWDKTVDRYLKKIEEFV